jgi:hypothetical protein
MKIESEITQIKSIVFLKALGSDYSFWNLPSTEKCNFAVANIFWIYIFVQNNIFSHENHKI